MSGEDADPVMDAEVARIIGGGTGRPWGRRPALWAGLGLLVLAAASVMVWRGMQDSRAAPVYVTEAVARGDLAITVMASGTLQPTRVVDIGSELSGTVSRVLVDVNDRVGAGQLLVELDTARLADQVVRSRATLAAAEARVAQAEATAQEAQSLLDRLLEVAELSQGRVPSAAELDSARAAVGRSRADQRSARADVASARAALSSDETNLSKALIRSPIDGVVLSRAVEPGNAVAASLQAVTLFTIAETLTQMRLQVSVDEADVGLVDEGQEATFTVSAYPGRAFPARITRVAFGSTITENVVTYLTDLDVDNADLSLRPGMTATATIRALERRDVLRVPNAALRFTPASAAATATAPASPPGGLVGSLMPRVPRGLGGRRAVDAAAPATTGRVWVLQDGVPAEIALALGVSDGRYTEVVGGELTEGARVIVDQRDGSRR